MRAMEVYLVGGAVRDELLGRAVEERDWVVVGSSPEEMIELGFRQVGRDFPVFLHPETKEEYALARTERKTAPGHGGFVCHTGPDVSLEDDLERRDLTINAMANHADGTRIDPYGGAGDIKQRVLRHVSDAFADDPLRVFRAARFAAQLPGFVVAEETLAVMAELAFGEELATLSAERVWGELEKALGGNEPQRFFAVLRAANTLQPWFLEFDGLEVSVPEELQQPLQRFGALGWLLSEAKAADLCARLKVPKAFARCMGHVCQHGWVLANWRSREPHVVVAALKALGAFRSDAGRAGFGVVLEIIGACSGADLTSFATVVRNINAGVKASRLGGELTGAAVGQALDAQRVEQIRRAQG